MNRDIIRDNKDESTHQHRLFTATHAILALVILLSCVMGGVAMALMNIRRSQVFHLWFRHMTSWNAIISSLWLLTVATIGHQQPNSMMIAFGFTTLLLNLFVFLVRWGWFRISKFQDAKHHVFGDIIIHALVPMITFLSVAMITSHASPSVWRQALVPSLLAFWIILILWYTINYTLSKLKILPWPYPNGAGRTIPRDIYKDPEQHTPAAIRAYMSLNAMIAISLTLLIVLFVLGRPSSIP